MSRYDWPRIARGRRRGARRGLAAARRQYNLDRSADFDIETLIATPVRRTAGAPVSARAGPATGFAPAAPPAGGALADRNLWLPVGPAGVLRGQADGDPRVSGRVRDIIVSPDGARAYAASALGGLWYSGDAGARWEPVGQWAMVPSAADVPASSNTLTCGAVHVRFDPAGNDPANDEVWVGTGEPGQTLVSPHDVGNHGQYAGVGILHAVGPVDTSRTNPLQDPWTREAQPRAAAGGNPAYAGLRGAAVFRFAVDPDNDRHLVAATTNGLHHNGGPAPDPWLQFSLPAWAGLVITDVAWTPEHAGVHPSLLWVAIVDTTAASPAGTAVWVSAAGIAGPFVQVALPGVASNGRLAIGAHPAFPDVVYVLGSGPRLWRLDVVDPFPAAPAVAIAVTRLPSTLYGANDQSQYDMAIAIDPRDVNRIIVGGAAAFRAADAVNGAALYRLTVSGSPPQTDYNATVDANAGDATWIGADVHADIHRVRWLAAGDDNHVWVTCDGGVFRSAAAGDLDSFVSRAIGLAVLEPGYLASHAISDGLALIGCQDNGTMMRIGESVWRNAVNHNDAGGVAFDPGTTGRFAAQRVFSDWADDADDVAGISPVRRITGPGGDAGREPAVFLTEHVAASFYSNPAVVLRGDNVTQLAVGTHRIWYSERWGASRWDAAAGLYQRSWTTLPSNTDPRAGNNATNANAARDVLAPGPGALGTIGIRVLRWAGPDRIYAMTRGAIYQLDRSPATTGTWTPNPPVALFTRASPPAALAWPVAGSALPDLGAYNDLAPHDPAAGPHGSLYIATSHPLEPVWWFDGQHPGQWYPARLGTIDPPTPRPASVTVPATGVRAPAYAVGSIRTTTGASSMSAPRSASGAASSPSPPAIRAGSGRRSTPRCPRLRRRIW